MWSINVFADQYWRDSLNNDLTLRERLLKTENEKLITQQKLLLNINEHIVYQNQLRTVLLILSLLTVLISIFCIHKCQKMKRERDQMVGRINQLLEDKNQQIAILNDELNHRVKNNLAFVWSLLRMQSRRLDSPEAKAAVREAESRIEAMALVHRRLYENDANRTIEMSDYLNQLCNYLVESYTSVNQNVSIQTNLEKLTLKADIAVQLGLIINELMTNSFKHAFSNQEYPVVKISLKRISKEAIELIYSDNGSGVDNQEDIQNSDSLGLNLIRDLTDQLNGTLHISNKSGAYFYFNFTDLKTD